MRKILLGLAGIAIGIGVISVPFASGSPTPDTCTKDRGSITCGPVVTESTPHRNWSSTEQTTVKGNFDSSHDPVEDTAALNPQGKKPPGAQ